MNDCTRTSLLEGGANSAHLKGSARLHGRSIDVGEVGCVANVLFVLSLLVEVFTECVLLTIGNSGSGGAGAEVGVIVVAGGVLELLEMHTLGVVKPKRFT